MFWLPCDALRCETSRSPLDSRPSSCPSLPCCPAPSSTGRSLTTLAFFGRCMQPIHLDLTLSSIRRNVVRRQTVCSTTPTCKFHQRPPPSPPCQISFLRLRTYLMYTTAAIMSIGVLFDILVVYYAKFVQPYLFQLFKSDFAETWTSSRKQWWRQSRMR